MLLAQMTEEAWILAAGVMVTLMSKAVAWIFKGGKERQQQDYLVAGHKLLLESQRRTDGHMAEMSRTVAAHHIYLKDHGRRLRRLEERKDKKDA